MINTVQFNLLTQGVKIVLSIFKFFCQMFQNFRNSKATGTDNDHQKDQGILAN